MHRQINEEVISQIQSVTASASSIRSAWEARVVELSVELDAEEDEGVRRSLLNAAAEEILVEAPTDLSVMAVTRYQGLVNSIRSELLGPLYDAYL